MATFIGRLKDMLFVKNQYKNKIADLKQKRVVIDERIQRLERKATVDGDEGWFLTKIRHDPSCALKILRECDQDDKT